MATKSLMIGRAVRKLREVITQPLYDTQTIPTGGAGWTQDLVFFANSNSAGRHPILSNMVLVGVLPAPRAVSIVGLSFYIPASCITANFKSILGAAALLFTVGDKEYWRGPAWMACQGGGMYGTGSDVNTNGIPSAANFFHFKQAVPVDTQVNFNVTLKAPGVSTTVSADVAVTCVLWTTEARAVQ